MNYNTRCITSPSKISTKKILYLNFSESKTRPKTSYFVTETSNLKLYFKGAFFETRETLLELFPDFDVDFINKDIGTFSNRFPSLESGYKAWILWIPRSETTISKQTVSPNLDLGVDVAKPM